MKSFETLFEVIGIVARRRFQSGERAFAAIGLNHTEARLLSALKRGASTQDALSNCLAVDRSNAGRALKRLEDRGYLVRRSHASDRRTNLVQITPKGRKTVTEIAKLRKKLAQDFFGELTSEQAEMIANLLKAALKIDGGEGERRG